MAENENSNIAANEVIFLILLALFVGSVSYYLYNMSNNVDVWEDFYAKQVATYLNAGLDGQEVSLDVQPIVKIAKGNGMDIERPESIFTFDAFKNEVCVKISKGDANCYPYFNEVAVRDVKFTAGTEGIILNFIIESKTEELNEQ